MIYAVVVVVLAATTFLSPVVYGSWWFVALWAVFALVLVASICSARMWRHAGSFLLHLSFIAMLGGGLATWLTRESGMLRIEKGETVDGFIDSDGKVHPLPVPVKLVEFEIAGYPGGVVVRDYISHLEVEGNPVTVSMNNVLDLKGYRLLQNSYDSEGATVLSVSHDPYGRNLSYGGYIMFAVGGLWILLARGGRFRRLLRSLSAALFISLLPLHSDAAAIDGVPLATADSLRTQQVLYNGRVVTFNTLARDVVTKLYGTPSYRGLTPEQTLLSFRLFPDRWKDEPIIKIKDKGIAEALGVRDGYVSLSDLFDREGNYRVSGMYLSAGEGRRRAVEDLDEKAGIILTLLSGRLIVARPDDVAPLTDAHVSAELVYNSIPVTAVTFMMLFAGFIAGMAVYLLLQSRAEAFSRWSLIPYVFLSGASVVSLSSFAMQWYLAGRLPLANTFETLEFVVLVMEILMLAVGRRHLLLMSLGLLMTGALALVAHLVASNPVVTPLMPVLHSGWLSLHVSLVMTAYAMLGFTFVVAAVALAVPSSALRMKTISLCLLYPGVYLLGLGIFTGAVWAEVSWGQYWAWDPKETWALVAFMVYAIPLHRRLRCLDTPRAFHSYLLLALFSLAMTYFGVNYLDSMHAYN